MENEIKFTHFVSKGSRFNQIYIPKESELNFEVGDKVEVRLIERNQKLYYSPNLKKLSEFKSDLIKNIFSCIKSEDISQIFIFGSFLTKKNDYNDIDILIISDKNLLRRVEKELNEEFDLKFHIIVVNKNKFDELLKICPLTRSMLYYSASDKKFKELPKREIDVNYTKFLLMFPKDLLEVELDSKSYYESLRRLEAIYLFLNNKEIDPLLIDKEIEDKISKNLIERIRDGKLIDKNKLIELRNIMKIKIGKIEEYLKNGKKGKH